MSERNTPVEAGSPEAMEADLVARRRLLTNDVQELASRLAPGSIKSQARRGAQSTVASVRGRLEDATDRVKDKARETTGMVKDKIGIGGTTSPASSSVPAAGGYGTVDSAGADATATAFTAPAPGAAPGATSGATAEDPNRSGAPTSPYVAQEPGLADRLSRLADDAQDGDPTSLAIMSGGALALAGVSIAALIKAVRS